MTPLSLITGPIGKIVSGLLLAAVAAGGIHYLLAAMQNYYVAQETVRTQAAQLVQIQADHQRELEALKLQSAATLARAQLALKTRSAINAAPRTTACATSPAIAALLRSLQSSAAPTGHDADPKAAAPVPRVSATARAAGDRH